jgi:SAM-dependent methyltransferase
LVAEAGAVEPPVLDVGCGDGLFAALALDAGAHAGVDVDRARLREALGYRAHRIYLCASAERLPVASESCGSVLANCVLEHVEDVEAALAEIARVLRPGGRLLFGVPGPQFGPFLLGSTLLARVGARALGDAYAGWFHRHSRHHHVCPPETWIELLARRGLEVERWRPYMSARAHRAFDLAHYASVPRWLRWRLTGRWVARPRGPVNALYERWLTPFALEASPRDGAYLFFEARRPLHRNAG